MLYYKFYHHFSGVSLYVERTWLSFFFFFITIHLALRAPRCTPKSYIIDLDLSTELAIDVRVERYVLMGELLDLEDDSCEQNL